MYQNPTLFPQITNRESWLQIIKIVDDDTGDAISLTDINNNPIYSIALEISPALPRVHTSGYGSSPWYGDYCEPSISASLADYISIVDVGTIQIMIPKSKMQTLCGRTYDVFLTIDPNGEDDGRQLLVGKLPVIYGGRNT